MNGKVILKTNMYYWYKHVKENFEYEPNLESQRLLITRRTTSAHCLRIETGRYRDREYTVDCVKYVKMAR
jgi:hypothetical protein